MIPVALMPFSLAALPLMPTDCVNSSREVKWNTSRKMTAVVATMMTGVGIGMPGMKLPIAVMIGLPTVGVAPPLIQYAMERPHV